MSNVVNLFGGERGDRTVLAQVDIGIDGLKSLFQNWSSITLSLEELQDYLDDLRPILEALPDSLEKAHVGLLMNEAELQIRDALTRSIGTTAAVARIRRDSE